MLSGLLKKFAGSTSVATIDHDALVQAHRDKSCTIVDVREPHEFGSGHIPGALNHPLSQFDPEKLARDKPIVLICQAGGRSATALRRAHAAGRQNVSHYPGGMSGWRSRGGAVV
jgi:rhodanese-related sulfurtransferase